MMQSLDDCRQRVHAWGKVNRVIFDAAKEHLVVIHPRDSHGEPFKLLGLMVDLDLRMHSAIDQLLAKIRPKSTAILRTRAYYNNDELITGVWLRCTQGAISMPPVFCYKKSRKCKLAF